MQKNMITNTNDVFLQRYSRQIVLPSIGLKGQGKLNDATVGVVGLGGLGTWVSEILARAGVGRLVLVDKDKVESSNLHRQSIYTEKSIGMSKALFLKEKLREINSQLEVHALDERFDLEKVTKDKSASLGQLLGNVDVLVDGLDTHLTKLALNEYALQNKLPFIYGGALQSRGAILFVLPHLSPCLKCLFPAASNLEQNCQSLGVYNTVCSMIGSMQAHLAMQFIINGCPDDFDKAGIYFQIELSAMYFVQKKFAIKCQHYQVPTLP